MVKREPYCITFFALHILEFSFLALKFGAVPSIGHYCTQGAT